MSESFLDSNKCYNTRFLSSQLTELRALKLLTSSCVTLLSEKFPLESAKMAETHLQCVTTRDVFSSLSWGKSHFLQLKMKKVLEGNEISQLHKSKDWLKFVTLWVKIIAITHSTIKSSAVNNLLCMLGWGMTVARDCGNWPQLQGRGSALS